MKKYIKSNVSVKQGSYVLDRRGNLFDIQMHVPSTTYLSRGIVHLCPTDADFLFSQGELSEDEAMAICLYCYAEFLEDELGLTENEVIPLTAPSQFNSYAELRYAPDVRILFFKFNGTKLSDVYSQLSNLPDFNQLNEKWYKFLQNQFVKVSIFNNQVEFRISSEDGYDWNKVIIDKFILRYDSTRSSTRYSILRESSKGYKAYFMNATVDDILENDKVVLATELLDRRVVNGRIRYVVGAKTK